MPNNCIRPEAAWISDFITPAFAEMCDIFCSYTPASECAHPLQDIAELAGADIADFFSAIVHSTPPKPSALPKGSAAPAPQADACESPRSRDVRERAGGSHDPCAPPPSLLASAYEGSREEPPMAPAMLAGHDAPFFHIGRGDFSSGNVTPLARSSTFNRAQHTPSLRSSYVDTRGLVSGGADSVFSVNSSWNPTPQPPLPAPTPTAAPLLALANEPLQIPSVQVCDRDGSPTPPVQGTCQNAVRFTANPKIVLEAPPVLAKSETAERYEDASEPPLEANVRQLSDLATLALEGWQGWQGTADDSIDSSEEWAALSSFAGDFAAAPVAQVVSSPNEESAPLSSVDDTGDPITEGPPRQLAESAGVEASLDPVAPLIETVPDAHHETAAGDAAQAVASAECAESQDLAVLASSPVRPPSVNGAEAIVDPAIDPPVPSEVCIINAAPPAIESAIILESTDEVNVPSATADSTVAAPSVSDDAAQPPLSHATVSLDPSAPASGQDTSAPFNVIPCAVEAVDAAILVSVAPRVSSPAEPCAPQPGPLGPQPLARPARPPLPPSASLLVPPANVVAADVAEEGVAVAATVFSSAIDLNQSGSAGFAWGQMHPGVPVGLGETLSQQDLVAALWGAHSRGEIGSTTSSSVGDPKMTSHSRSDSFSSDCSWVVVDSVP